MTDYTLSAIPGSFTTRWENASLLRSSYFGLSAGSFSVTSGEPRLHRKPYNADRSCPLLWARSGPLPGIPAYPFAADGAITIYDEDGNAYPITSPYGTSSAGRSAREAQLAGVDQSTFILATINYTPGSGDLAVYINGVRQHPDAYTEIDTVTVIMAEFPEPGSELLFEVSEPSPVGATGPAGPMGIAGPAGPVGATGPAGASVDIASGSFYSGGLEIISGVATTPGWNVISEFVMGTVPAVARLDTFILVSKPGITCNIKLFDVTLVYDVPLSSLNTSSTSGARLASSNLVSNLHAGNRYQIQVECVGDSDLSAFAVVRYAVLSA
jgi:hypothetical protein